MQPYCAFCEIVAGLAPADIVWEDEYTMAFVDLRQANPGHTLVIPREHVADVRDLDPVLGGRLMAVLSRVVRAVDSAFPNEGLSVWHSIGPGAFQEVPHMHLHVHPRQVDDGLLRVYPGRPEAPDTSELSEIAERIRVHLES
jgi:histidine triad (HIT) family protein